MKGKILAILQIAQDMAEGEILEKIRLAIGAIKSSDNWQGAFTAGYYASWAEGLANQLQGGTELCNLLNQMIELLTFQPKKKIIIVKQGHWTDVREGEYESMIASLRGKGGLDEEVEVKLALTFNDALDLLEQEEVAVVVFIAKEMLPEAKRIKDNYSKVRVVVFTGLLPELEEHQFSGLVLVNVREIIGQKAMREAVLGT